jgi:O-antigen ligase
MKAIVNKIYPYTISLLFIFPLLKVSLMNLVLIVFSLFTIIHFFTQKENKKIIFRKEIVLLVIPFFIVLFTSFFYWGEKSVFKPLDNALYYLIFPLTFMFTPQEFFSKEKVQSYLTVLKISCLIVAIGFVFSFLYYYSVDDFFSIKYNVSAFRDFVYNEIPFFRIHPTYFSTIILFCIASSLENIRLENKKNEIGFIIVFSLITISLLAKLNIVLLLLLFTYYFLFKFNTIKIANRIISTIILLATLLTLGIQVPGIKNRFQEVFSSFQSQPKGLAYDSTNIRIALYKCDWEIIQENWIKGIGFHNGKEAIKNCLENNYDSSFFENHLYLSHNYYFYILMSSGIIGLLFFLLYLFSIYKQIVKVNEFIIYVLFISIMLVSLTEDFFYRNIGLFFFSLIYLTFFKREKII